MDEYCSRREGQTNTTSVRNGSTPGLAGGNVHRSELPVTEDGSTSAQLGSLGGMLPRNSLKSLVLYGARYFGGDWYVGESISLDLSVVGRVVGPLLD